MTVEFRRAGIVPTAGDASSIDRWHPPGHNRGVLHHLLEKRLHRILWPAALRGSRAWPLALGGC